MIKQSNPKLHKTFWFWIALISPLLISIDLVLVISYLSPNLEFSMAADSINKLIASLQLPLAIASLSIPFVAMVAAVHRSSQTAHQISVQTEQNNFANHFKHLEEFSKAMDSMIPAPWDTNEDFHAFVYPYTLKGSIEPSTLFNLAFDADYRLLDYIEACQKTPLIIPKLTKKHYLNAIYALGAPPLKRSTESLLQPTPLELLKLFQSVNRAVTFSGIHNKPFKLSSELLDPIKEINSINAGFIYFLSNANILIQALRTEEDTESSLHHFFENSPVDKDYYRLGAAYAWSIKAQEMDNDELNGEAFSDWRKVFDKIKHQSLKHCSNYWDKSSFHHVTNSP